MIEILSSKIDSLSERNSENMNTGAKEFQSENVASTSRICETESMTQDEGLCADIIWSDHILIKTAVKMIKHRGLWVLDLYRNRKRIDASS